MASLSRAMITLKYQETRFFFRAAALIEHDDHILVQRTVGMSNWALPGGRIEISETGAEALIREIGEELGVSAKIGALRFIIENFYQHKECNTHSIGLYYEVTLEQPLAFNQDVVHRVRDGNIDLEFRWMKRDFASLQAVDLRPIVLCELLMDMPAGISHRINRD